MFCSLYSFKCFLNNMFSCLCKHLNCDIIRNKIFVNKTANKFKFCMRRCRKTYFDFLKTELYKEFEKFDRQDFSL